MLSNDSVRSAIECTFQNVEDIGDNVVRAERCHDGKTYTVAYFDLSDSIVERASHLKEFQEGLVGSSFFAPDSDLRWNSYLYFIAGPKSKANKDFDSAKNRIEADRHFARKLVLNETDFARQFGQREATALNDPTKVVDVNSTWATLLREASLSILLEQRPRTATLELIVNGEAFKAEGSPVAAEISRKSEPLNEGFLRTLSIGTFRKVNNQRHFSFGDVNLIVGANGTGKTSLLEAIEVLYCGRVRRDSAASFSKLSATVESSDGTLSNVIATSGVATIKGRNMSWYGRADIQAQAITQGFTRFNFLDTDAAFRLASDDSSEDIQTDVSRLLVGSETSKLWTHISKLEGEVAARLRSVEERLPSERKQVELLADDVKRLKESPSEARTLLDAFHSTVRSLQPRWQDFKGQVELLDSDRERLFAASEAIAATLSEMPSTPVTPRSVRERLTLLESTLASAKKVSRSYDDARKKAAELKERASATQSRQQQLAQWAKYLDAGVQDISAKLEAAETKQQRLLKELKGLPDQSPLEVLPEYARLSIGESLKFANAEGLSAQQQFDVAQLALQQGLKLGQSLQMLRRDLHDASSAYIQRSGESSMCPVCATPHVPSELLAKINGLIASEEVSLTSGIRQTVQIAQERVSRMNIAIETLKTLAVFATLSGATASMTSGELFNSLRARTEELRATTTELQNLHSAEAALTRIGLDRSNWHQVRLNAISALGTPDDIDNAELLRQHLDNLKMKAEVDAAAFLMEDKNVSGIQSVAVQIATGANLNMSSSLTPTQIEVALERQVANAKASCSRLDEVAAVLAMNAETTLEDLLRRVNVCLVNYDKALAAVKRDETAGRDLGRKQSELSKATERLTEATSARDNLDRARQALSTVVAKHSLDRATAEAFDAIKGKVSEVFAQIHSPPEYELGRFANGQLLVGRDDKTPRQADQVSTGQRAALALSIFLALNENAKTAPPVMLIDDPVAHIDDLNALLFLDYLRELVLRSRKQVFFATADVRLAALFQKKFEFLGPQRFKRTVLG